MTHQVKPLRVPFPPSDCNHARELLHAPRYTHNLVTLQISFKSDDRDQNYDPKTTLQVPNSFAPEPVADHHPPMLLFEAGAALRVMSTTDVRQHTILLNFKIICLHQRACSGKICDSHIFRLTENLEI